VAQDTPAAQPPPEAQRDFGIQTALRIGRAFPMGQLADAPTGGFSDNVTPQTMVTFDVGLRYKRWVFGIFLGLGGGGVDDSQKAGFHQLGFDNSPSVFSFNLGPEVHYHFLDTGPVRPWVGLGTGVELLAIGVSQGSLHLSDNYTAWQMFRPMAGVDFKITKGFGLGLYADMSVARFGSHEVTISDESQKDASGAAKTVKDVNVEITNPAFHEWMTVGVRVTLGT
jgi:hypothetical protein